MKFGSTERQEKKGEKNGSAKGSFVREGFFTDVDAALCVHPAHRYSQTLPSLANDPVDVKFLWPSFSRGGGA